MILADFTITVELEPPRSVRVVVYETVKGLRGAATRYDNKSRSKRRKKKRLSADLLGVCHRFELFDKKGELLPLCAIVRLAEPYLGVGIVSHELAHAALWIHELRDDVPRPLVCDNDEPFVWILGELVRQTINALYIRGVYDAKEGGGMGNLSAALEEGE